MYYHVGQTACNCGAFGSRRNAYKIGRSIFGLSLGQMGQQDDVVLVVMWLHLMLVFSL